MIEQLQVSANEYQELDSCDCHTRSTRTSKPEWGIVRLDVFTNTEYIPF